MGSRFGSVRLQERIVALLPPVTQTYLVLTIAAFASPVLLQALPSAAPAGGILAASFVSAAVVLFQAAALVVCALRLAAPPWTWRFLLPVAVADLLAGANAARLALGVRWAGLGPEMLEVLWFAAPHALWALAVIPALRAAAPWWASPARWIVRSFPLIFLLAAFSRVDFRPYVGTAPPPAVAAFLAYTPTVLVLGLALLGWLAFEERGGLSPRELRRRTARVLLPGATAGVLVSAVPSLGSIASATITWGSGYQMFLTGPDFAPLSLSFVLVGAGVAAFLAVLVGLRRENRPTTGLILALAAVLSGIFSLPGSVLGSLLALELLWLTVAPRFRP